MGTRKEAKKQQKKKKRDQVKKQRVLKQRSVIRDKARSALELHRREKKIKRLQKSMENIEYWAEDFLKTLPEKTLNQLQHNAEILRALEAEYEGEIATKRKLNDELEKEGHFTMEEKMQALCDKNTQAQKDVGVGGSADCSMLPNPPKEPEVSETKKETAEVSVTKISE